MLTDDLMEARTIKSYKAGLFTYDYVLNNPDVKLTDKQFPSILRAFFWYSQKPPFEDVIEISKAIMPVFGGYVIKKIREGESTAGYPLSHIKTAMSVLASYLDGDIPQAYETMDSSHLITMPCYSMEDDIKKMKNLLKIDKVIEDKEKELHDNAGTVLKSILKKTPSQRLSLLKECFSDITACKNCTYGIIRMRGKYLIKAIEKHIYNMQPADQDYILHGLDAFPKNSDVLEFYERFLSVNKYESLKTQVEKYYSRVKKGKKTTGWET